MAGGIAHDFNNLLAIIRLNLEALGEQEPIDAEAREMVTTGLHAVEQGASLTHQLLAYARQQPLEPKILNPEALVRRTMNLAQRTLGENIQIKTMMPSDLWKIRVDPHQLDNALLNLVLNSRDAMPDGGLLTITGANKILDDIYAEDNNEVVPGPYVLLSLTDTGVGMSKDILEQVLEPFFTTKVIGQGTGLGLSMVYGFVKQSGGHLKIYSEPGLGTTINLYFPRAQVDADHLEASEGQNAPPACGTESILVVEDNESLRNLTVRILKDLGYMTIGAEDGPAAFRILDSLHLDLLLTDVVLPKGITDPELVRRIGARQPDLKVLYMSGHPRDPGLLDITLGRRVHFLSKPFSRAELARKVRDALDAGDGT
jgi:CheY-like chemotaxis protein